jgi:UDP-N-acetylglucosamine 4-epimerase
MQNFSELKDHLKNKRYRWLVTGCAGFIGSNLVEFLLLNNQKVIGLDNFSTGKEKNLDSIKNITSDNYDNFNFIEGDIRDIDTCLKACEGIDFVLHQAALGSVPRSIKDPIASHDNNVNGQLNMLYAAKEKGVKNFVYASSSSVYGDHPVLPKVEEQTGELLSPYAVTKYVNELYGRIFWRSYEFKNVGIRYFNVFGKRQDPDSIYAAVIPKWVKAMLHDDNVYIFGDGTTSRDFCYIENVVQMNLLAALTKNKEAYGKVFNCACNDQTSLNDLFGLLKNGLAKYRPSLDSLEPLYQNFRVGDVKHSNADIDKAKKVLGYLPKFYIKEGLALSLEWYYNDLK